MEAFSDRIFVKLSTDKIAVYTVEKTTNRLQYIYNVENVGPLSFLRFIPIIPLDYGLRRSWRSDSLSQAGIFCGEFFCLLVSGRRGLENGCLFAVLLTDLEWWWPCHHYKDIVK